MKKLGVAVTEATQSLYLLRMLQKNYEGWEAYLLLSSAFSTRACGGVTALKAA